MNISDVSALVLETLRRAASQNTELLKPAEHQLKKWETEPFFYTSLLSVFSNHSVDTNVRWLAVLYFKNGVDRYWRKTAPNAINEEEKKILRKQLLSNFSEPVNQLALQLAVLISKISRFDCPKEWPELLPTLLEAVRISEDHQQQRVLLILYHVIKTLSSKRLAADRRVFHELTSNIFSYIFNLWKNYTELFLQSVTQKQSSVGVLLEKSLLSLKVLRKLTVYGFKEPHDIADAVSFLLLVFQMLKPFLECRKSLSYHDHMKELCEKYLITLMKLLNDMLELHPFSYVQFVKPSLQCVVSFCFSAEGEGLLFERFIVQCLNLVKSILLCVEYKPAKSIEETKEPATLDAHRAKLEFFSYDVLIEVCRRILTHYFLLSEDELTSWSTVPEEFAVDEGGESWKYTLKPCTEGLFLALLHEFRQSLTPFVLEMTQNLQRMNVRTFDMQSILYKDALYNAVGLAAFDLYGDIDFDAWFTQSLCAELKIKDSGYKIIRRRVIWLIGQWVGVKLSPMLRPLLYETVLNLLDANEDLVVRLAAANTLKIDDFEFNTEQFLPYLETAVGLLYQLLKQVSECDTKMTVLHVLSFIIERVGSLIRPYAAGLVHYLPLLWETSGDHNMLRCAIISTLESLVQGLGTLSEQLHSFLLPVIMLSTDVTQPSHVYLLGDGLELWWAVLENTSVCTPDLLALARNLLPLLELSSENLRICLQIIQGYVVLTPNDFLRTCGADIVQSLCSFVKDMRSEGIIMILKVVELVFVVFPDDGPQLFRPLLPFVFDIVLDGKELPIMMSSCLSVLARVILHSQQCFSQLLQKKASEDRKQVEEVFTKFLDIWLEKMPLVQPIERRKLMGLTLTSMLATDSSVVTEHICGILLAVCEVLNDVMQTDGMGETTDSLVLTNSDPQQQDEDEETEHDRRKKELSRQDPVHVIVLKDYLSFQLSALQRSLSTTSFDQVMSSVDVETMQMLREYVQA